MKYMPGTLYLESSDFQGMKLKPEVTGGRKCVIMLQSLGCGHCTNAKPAFHKLSQTVKDTLFCTIQADEQQDIARKLMGAYKLQGVPAYIGVNSDGSPAGVFNGGRDEASLQKYAQTLK
jgi:hypothetical protein